jgi:hypothetical protein
MVPTSDGIAFLIPEDEGVNTLAEALTGTRSSPRQPETLIGQVRRDGEPYPADPHWHDCAFNNDLPSTEEASGMKESYQKEQHCRDKRKGSLGHFNLAEKIP